MKARSLCVGIAAALSLAAVAPWPGVAGATDDPSAGHFTCRASALRVSSPLVFSEPIVANRAGDPCRDEFAQALSANVPGLVRTGVLNAKTDVESDHATSRASTADAVVTVGGSRITATVLEAHAVARCDPKTGQPALSGSSRVLALTINGKPIAVDGTPRTIPVNGLVTVYLNQQVKTSDRLTQRALRISSPLLRTDIVVSEAIVDVHGNPCGAPPQCSDKIDNDGDKLIDYPDDRGCSSPEDDDESDEKK